MLQQDWIKLVFQNLLFILLLSVLYFTISFTSSRFIEFIVAAPLLLLAFLSPIIYLVIIIYSVHLGISPTESKAVWGAVYVFTIIAFFFTSVSPHSTFGTGHAVRHLTSFYQSSFRILGFLLGALSIYAIPIAILQLLLGTIDRKEQFPEIIARTITSVSGIPSDIVEFVKNIFNK